MAKTKLSDEELSRVLSAHANGEMTRRGTHLSTSGKACVLEVASTLTDDLFYSGSANEWEEWRPCTWRYGVAQWFDANYNPGWPLGKFLRELERQGLA